MPHGLVIPTDTTVDQQLLDETVRSAQQIIRQLIVAPQFLPE